MSTLSKVIKTVCLFASIYSMPQITEMKNVDFYVQQNVDTKRYWELCAGVYEIAQREKDANKSFNLVRFRKKVLQVLDSLQDSRGPRRPGIVTKSNTDKIRESLSPAILEIEKYIEACFAELARKFLCRIRSGGYEKEKTETKYEVLKRIADLWQSSKNKHDPSALEELMDELFSPFCEKMTLFDRLRCDFKEQTKGGCRPTGIDRVPDAEELPYPYKLCQPFFLCL